MKFRSVRNALGLGLATVALFAFAATAAARPTARAARTAKPITRAPGVAKPASLVGQGLSAWSGPSGLSTAAKKAVVHAAGIDAAPGTVYARASAQQPMEPNKMALVPVEAEVLNPIGNFVSFAKRSKTSKHDRFAGLWLKSAAPGARYLMDCAVRVVPSQGMATVIVKFEDGRMMADRLPAGDHHVSWVVDSPDAKWHSFQIRSSSRWSLHGCESTRL
ncbi:MAG: hypothetical protein AAF721_05245 [Myxococcota bacterium]